MKTKHLSIPTVAALLCFAANAQTSDTSTITTSDGKTYQNVEVLRADPDGIIISYQPEKPGIGMAKLKFANLPDLLRNRYSYDADRSSAFATSQAQANAQWRAQQTSTEEYFAKYRALAELNRSLGGDALTSYSISLSPDGKLSAQGFTGSYPPSSYFYPWQNYGMQNYSNGGASPGGASPTSANRPLGY